MLEETLLERMNKLYGEGKWRLMHDNARPHKAPHTQDFLVENDIRVLDHPPYSSDLNPIELVWAYLKRRVMDREPKDLDEVLNRIFEEWYNIPLTMLNNLIDGHTGRVQGVHELNGAFFSEILS